jgi:hypothetical protein
MIININSKDAHKKEILQNGETRLTYYFKNPIVLKDEYDLYINDFHLKKRINSQIIEYENELASVLNNSSDREILPRTYNTNVESVSVENVVLYEWDGVSAFNATNARATVSTIATEPDLTTGQILVDAITTPGTGFIVNNFLYIDKNDLTTTLNTYTNRYAEIKITELVDDDVALTLTNYSSVAVFPATQDPINERTYNDVFLYEDDGAGWYVDSGVRANVEVKYPYAGATFANINILSITDGGSGIALNQFLYIDKSYIIDGEPTMTYTVRFAKYQVSELVNGLATTVLSANVEILANPRERDFVDEVITNVPLLKLESGNYINSGALVNVNISENNTNDNRGKATINVIVEPGKGFLPFQTYYIDKDVITQNNNTYDPASRYASYIVNTTTNNTNLEVVFLTNYGFNNTPLGNYYYDIPNKDTRIYLNIYVDQTYGNMARIIYTEGIRQGFVVNEEITIPSTDIIDESTGLAGWNKTLASGDLKIKVLSLTSVIFNSFNYKIYLENILYNTTKYFNSSSDGRAIILNIDPLYKYINGNNYVLSLTPQIIQEFKFIVNRELQGSDNIMFSFSLKNNNLLK